MGKIEKLVEQREKDLKTRLSDAEGRREANNELKEKIAGGPKNKEEVGQGKPDRLKRTYSTEKSSGSATVHPHMNLPHSTERTNAIAGAPLQQPETFNF